MLIALVTPGNNKFTLLVILKIVVSCSLAGTVNFLYPAG